MSGNISFLYIGRYNMLEQWSIYVFCIDYHIKFLRIFWYRLVENFKFYKNILKFLTIDQLFQFMI